jgi:hypothetical protein
MSAGFQVQCSAECLLLPKREWIFYGYFAVSLYNENHTMEIIIQEVCCPKVRPQYRPGGVKDMVSGTKQELPRA